LDSGNVKRKGNAYNYCKKAAKLQIVSSILGQQEQVQDYQVQHICFVCEWDKSVSPTCSSKYTKYCDRENDSNIFSHF